MRTRLKGLGLVLSLLPVIPVDAEPVELAPGVTPEEVRMKTGCHVHLAHLATA